MHNEEPVGPMILTVYIVTFNTAEVNNTMIDIARNLSTIKVNLSIVDFPEVVIMRPDGEGYVEHVEVVKYILQMYVHAKILLSSKKNNRKYE